MQAKKKKANKMNLDTVTLVFLREALSDSLVNSEMTIKFTKADKSEREMKITLKSEFIEETGSESGFRPTKNLDNLSVIEVDTRKWKSFNITSLIEIDGLPVADWGKKFLELKLSKT